MRLIHVLIKATLCLLFCVTDLFINIQMQLDSNANNGKTWIDCVRTDPNIDDWMYQVTLC